MWWILILKIALTVVVVGLPLAWVVASIKRVGPQEMAVMVIFEQPWIVCDSGIRFVPWLFGWNYLVRYPKKIFNLEYKDIEVITMAKEYPEGKEDSQLYGATKIKVEAAEYLNFPRPKTDRKQDDITHPLIKILRAGVPTDDKGLQAWTKESVEGAVRLAFGQITWKQAAEDMHTVNAEVERIFKDDDNTLVRAGFREPGIKLVVSKIVLPPALEKALTKPEEARLEAEAAVKDAEAQAIDRLETILFAIARSEGVDIGVIKDRVKNDEALRRELLDYVKDLHADIEKADRKAYFKLESTGNPFLDAITLWKQMTSGGGSGASSSGSNPGSQENSKGQGSRNSISSGSSEAVDDVHKKVAEDFFKRYKLWPKWDPLKRTPSE